MYYGVYINTQRGNTIMATPLTPAEELAEKISNLEQRILSNAPDTPQYLNFVHNALLQQPELTYMLSNEQRAVIVSGLSKITQTTIITAAAKSGAKKSKGVTLSDLGL